MTNIAIENGHRNSGFSMKNGGSFHSYVKLPEGNYWDWDNIFLWELINGIHGINGIELWDLIMG